MTAVGTMFIEEYNGIFYEEGRGHPLPSEPTVTRVITIDDSTAASGAAAFRTDTRFIRLANDGPSGGTNFLISLSPTATSTTRWMPDNTVEFFKVTGGDNVSVLGS